jgi:hypothetical protein
MSAEEGVAPQVSLNCSDETLRADPETQEEPCDATRPLWRRRRACYNDEGQLS